MKLYARSVNEYMEQLYLYRPYKFIDIKLTCHLNILSS